MVDTGANIPVLNKGHANRNTAPSSYKLYAANGSKIKSYGETTLTLDLGLRRSSSLTFVIADVSTPIPGADFLGHFQLLVDIKRRTLIDGVAEPSTPGNYIITYQASVRTIQYKSGTIGRVLSKYEDITRPSSLNASPKYNVEHHIITTGPPASARPRPLPSEKYALARYTW